MKQINIKIFFLLTLCLCIPTKANTEVCESYVLKEVNTNTILEELDSKTPRAPASMVKLMLTYSVFKKIKEGAVKLDDEITASAKASQIGGSQVFLKEYEKFKLSNLLEAVLIQSANDASYALAEHLGGSSEGFVEIMNEDAKSIGMNNSKFHSPHGLPPSEGQNPDMVSAEDFVILSTTLIKEFPEVLEYTKIKEMPFRDGSFIMRNHNKLLFNDESVDGLKTGFYNKAGFNVTVSAKKDNIRLIAVLMGCPDRKERDQLASSLIKKGFLKYTSKDFSVEELTKNLMVPVPDGTPRELSLITDGPIKITVDRKMLPEIKIIKNTCAKLNAPVLMNSECGEVNIMLGDKILASKKLITKDASIKAGIYERIKRKIGLS